MRIVIEGPPVPKARPKFRAAGKFQKAYDPQKPLMDAIALTIKKQIPEKFLLQIPLVIYMSFETTIPESSDNKTKKAHSWNSYQHISKPDIDNFVKFYLDLLNGIAYDDDRQIIQLNVKKIYSNENKTVIDIMPAKTYDSALTEFLELIDVNEFCDLSRKLNRFSELIQSIAVLHDTGFTTQESAENLVYTTTKEAFLILREISSKYGQTINKIAKKHKDLEET